MHQDLRILFKTKRSARAVYGVLQLGWSEARMWERHGIHAGLHLKKWGKWEKRVEKRNSSFRLCSAGSQKRKKLVSIVFRRSKRLNRAVIWHMTCERWCVQCACSLRFCAIIRFKKYLYVLFAENTFSSYECGKDKTLHTALLDFLFGCWRHHSFYVLIDSIRFILIVFARSLISFCNNSKYNPASLSSNNNNHQQPKSHNNHQL